MKPIEPGALVMVWRAAPRHREYHDAEPVETVEPLEVGA